MSIQRKARSYGLRVVSHWQGSQPGPVLATFTMDATGKTQASALKEVLITCSFCAPGRTAAYAVGTCYEVISSWREPGYIAEDLLSPRELETLTGLAG